MKEQGRYGFKEMDDLESAFEETYKEVWDEKWRQCRDIMDYIVLVICALCIVACCFMLAPYVDRELHALGNWYHEYYQNVLNSPAP